MRITENVTWQEIGQPVSPQLGSPDLSQSRRLRHAVNLYRPRGKAGLGADQRATIETMRLARRFTAMVGDRPTVDHVAVTNAFDAHLIPEDFESGGVLQRTMCDLSGFEHGPPLPFLFEILRASVPEDQSAADTHLIFTNADICLQPNFYLFVQAAIAAGFDSLVVNRRTIPADAIHLPAAIAGIDFGEPHPGLDCFVFPSEWVDGFVVSDACVGAGLVMRSLLHNLVARAESLLVVADGHLTFHFGDDRPWQSEEFRSYTAHNRQQGDLVHQQLTTDAVAAKRLADFHQAKPKYRATGDPGDREGAEQ